MFQPYRKWLVFAAADVNAETLTPPPELASDAMVND
jgi:hypothetical protein